MLFRSSGMIENYERMKKYEVIKDFFFCLVEREKVTG